MYLILDYPLQGQTDQSNTLNTSFNKYEMKYTRFGNRDDYKWVKVLPWPQPKTEFT